MIYYDRFIPEWLKRADRQEETVDDCDRFISLWIAFNGWMKSEYGENKNDRYLIQSVIGNAEIKSVFEELKIKSVSFQKSLQRLNCCRIIDMRDEFNKGRYKEYDGSFDSLMQAIYQIRCNLFHGRKNVDGNKKDFELIQLALRILKSLFQEYLKKHRP